jgi:hypothetical protein
MSRIYDSHNQVNGFFSEDPPGNRNPHPGWKVGKLLGIIIEASGLCSSHWYTLEALLVA